MTTMKRLAITKTPKCYVGGAFIRSESGRVVAWQDHRGEFFANIPVCSRKDLRNAVEVAAKAGSGWAKRSGYNRGQILYRLAEMLEARHAEMASALALDGRSARDADNEVSASIDRLVHYAGWTDKFQALLGSVNPVATPHDNVTVTEPMGVIGVMAPDHAPLLALISLIAPAIASGNAVVALASSSHPYPAILLGEMLATSDLPGGVVNLLTGDRAELVSAFANHEQIRGILAVVSGEDHRQLDLGAAESVKRVKVIDENTVTDWSSESCQGLEWIRGTIECKTTWHPIGV
ncbi:MAG: NAD/NADP-dependent betaine aldehyde dehydrogenase [Verrucomicrobiota bacterium]|jgi:acyl-CoA reductase-like NAD-dependent aldehyde dehydrogenase